MSQSGFYAELGMMTDPGENASLLADLPADIVGLVAVVQGLLLHIFWAERYGVELSEERKAEVGIRAMPGKLSRIQELSAAPLTSRRPLEQRLVGNCRDFSVLLCSFLQHQGVPARARCGFGTYFVPGWFEDHWVCEYWSTAENRWVLVDAQLDEFQCQALEVEFDPLDVPRDRFITGGKAWQMCRQGHADPGRFGIMEWYGLWFVRGNLVRDFLAMNKIEVLPWDGWGLTSIEEDELTAGDLILLDQVAALTLGGAESFQELRHLYASDAHLQMPPNWPNG